MSKFVMHYLYILYSQKKNKYYVGETSDIQQRLLMHNEHYFKNNFSKISDDWKLKLSFQTEERSDAIYLEKFIKRMKSSRFIEKIINNPIILQDILEKRTN